MKSARVPFCFALLLVLPASPSFGGVPKLNVKAICHSREADAKILRSTPDQSLAECMHDEEAAKEQLAGVWASTAVVIKSRCESDARSLGTISYLDLLTCIQME